MFLIISLLTVQYLNWEIKFFYTHFNSIPMEKPNNRQVHKISGISTTFSLSCFLQSEFEIRMEQIRSLKEKTRTAMEDTRGKEEMLKQLVIIILSFNGSYIL